MGKGVNDVSSHPSKGREVRVPKAQTRSTHASGATPLRVPSSLHRVHMGSCTRRARRKRVTPAVKNGAASAPASEVGAVRALNGRVDASVPR
jgi:hypothetical protein